MPPAEPPSNTPTQIAMDKGSAEPSAEDQSWFHHPEMQARIAEAEADFREGRFTRTSTPEEAQAYLDSLKRVSE